MAKKDSRVVTYHVDGDGYKITVMDAATGRLITEYSAGNNPRDSQQPAAPGHEVPLIVLRAMAKQTAEEMAIEHGIPLDRVTEEKA